MDPRTLSSVLGLMALVSAGLVGIYGRLIPTTRGSAAGATASACLAAGFGLLSLRGAAPYFWTVVAANVLVVASAGLYHLAICRIRRMPCPILAHAAILAVVAGGFQFVWNDLQGDYVMRVFVVNSLLAGQFSLCALTLLGGPQARHAKERRLMRLGVVLFAALTASALWRVLSHTGWFGQVPDGLLANVPANQVIVLFLLAGLMTFPVAFVALNNLRTEMELHRSAETFRSIVESSPTGMYFYTLETDDRLVLSGANPAAETITGLSNGALRGKVLEEAFPGLLGTTVPETYRRVAQGETGAQSFELAYRDDRLSGYYQVNVFRTGPATIAVDCSDISERKRLERELTLLASIDALTGASNRRFFLERAGEEWKRCRRYGIGMAVLMIDVDRFKGINDAHGHDVGDKALGILAARIQQLLRDTDIFGRMGGEEFGAVLVHADENSGRRTAERLRRACEALELPTPTGTARLTASFGVATLTPEDASFESLLKRADKALYAAKRAGRNRVTAA